MMHSWSSWLYKKNEQKRGERSIWPFQVLRIPNCLMALIIIVSLYKRDVYCARIFCWYLFTHWPSLLQSSLNHCHYRIHEYTLIVKGNNISRLRAILCFEVILADWSKLWSIKYPGKSSIINYLINLRVITTWS